MFRLTTLGSPALADDAGAEIRSVLAQPKRLAVLAYMAAERSRGFVRRETLLALFWPDADAESARRALRQTLYHLRRETTEDLFVVRSADEIAVNQDVLWCDAADFGRLAGERRFLEAMALYQGDFLPAFAFANQAPEFEQWLDSARGRYRGQAAIAAATLRDDTERAGDRDAASAWAKVAAQLSPDDERVTRRLIEVLDAAGDRGAALRTYEEFAKHLWSAYQARPAGPTEALVAEIRARTATGTAPPATPPASVAPAAGAVYESEPAASATQAPDRADSASGDASIGRTPASSRTTRARWGLYATIGGIAGVLVVAGVGYHAWPGPGGPNRSRGVPPILAVLPFTHEGPAADGYLADGITDDIRGRLAGLPGLRVIAGASSARFATAHDGVQRIGQELGATYLLTGRVIRASPNDSTHWRVTPELIRVSDATTEWTKPFDAAQTQIVDVQSRVAASVVQALHVDLTDSARAALSRLPTENGAAYDAYLRGSQIFASAPADAPVIRNAVSELERAVALDTTFAPAWAQLAVARTRLYENSGTLQRFDITRAKFAAERALALDSTLPNARAAMAGYYQVGENDQPAALRQLRAGLRYAPRDPSLLTLVALSERAEGQWDSAVGHLRQAQAIDPRDGTVLYDLGVTLFVLRRFPEARVAAQQAAAIEPSAQGLQLVSMLSLADGDLPAAREVMTQAGRTLDQTSLVTFVATYGDQYWVLDDQQQALLRRLTPSSFGDDRFNWSYALAQMAWLAGDSAAVRAYADTARREGEASSRNDPAEPQTHAMVGVAHAMLGHREAALREGLLAASLCPIEKDALTSVYVLQQLARIYILLGDDDRAVATTKVLLQIPSYVSAGWLRVDPTFAPLKRDAEFRRLIGEP